MLQFEMLHPQMTYDHLGYIPYWLSEDNEKGAAEQINENYGHGGGWRSFKGFEYDPVKMTLKYPGDPAYRPLAVAHLREEKVIFYDSSWVAVVQPDGTYDVARID